MMDGGAYREFDMAHVPLQQHPAHAAALSAIGTEARIIALPDGGQATAMLRRFGPLGVALVPRGPVWPTPRAADLADLRALRPHLPKRTALVVNAEAPIPAALRAWPLITPQTIAEWDLSAAPDELRRGLHQKWRNRLARAERMDLPIRHRPMPVDPGHWLLRHADRQARDRRYRSWPPALIAAHAALGTAQLFVAGPASAPVAAMLFLVTGQRATYQTGWSDAAGRAADAHRRLLWHAALSLRSHGVRLLDLGQVDTENAPGLARFKLGTGARARRLGPTLLVV